MRRSKEIIVLLVLLLGMMGFVIWYVIDRRTKLQDVPAAPSTPAAAPVDLTQHDNQTIDFSGGTPAVKDNAEDRAAIEQAKKDMAEAVKGITFGPPAKKVPPPPAPSAEPPKP